MTTDELQRLFVDYYPSARNLGLGSLRIAAKKLEGSTVAEVEEAIEKVRGADLQARDIPFGALFAAVPRPRAGASAVPHYDDGADWVRVGAPRCPLGLEMLASEQSTAEERCAGADWVEWFETLNRAGQYIQQFVPHEWPVPPGVFTFGPHFGATDWGANGTMDDAQIERLLAAIESELRREAVKARIVQRRANRLDRLTWLVEHAEALRVFGPISHSVREWLITGLSRESYATNRVMDEAPF